MGGGVKHDDAETGGGILERGNMPRCHGGIGESGPGSFFFLSFFFPSFFFLQLAGHDTGGGEERVGERARYKS